MPLYVVIENFCNLVGI